MRWIVVTFELLLVPAAVVLIGFVFSWPIAAILATGFVVTMLLAAVVGGRLRGR
jgi:hypothetical protein